MLSILHAVPSLPVSDNQRVVLQTMLVVPKLRSQTPVRQYLWYPASAAVDAVVDYYCTLIF